MKLWHRIALWAFVTMGLCGCHRHVEDLVRAEEQAVATSHSDTHETVSIHEEPSRVTVTTEEFAAEPVSAGIDSGSSPRVPRPGISVAPAVPATGRLIRRTVRVEDSGAVSEAISQNTTAGAETTVHAEAKASEVRDSAPAASCAFAGWLWGLALIGAALIAGRILIRKWLP